MHVMRFLHGYQGADFDELIGLNAIVMRYGTPQMGNAGTPARTGYSAKASARTVRRSPPSA